MVQSTIFSIIFLIFFISFGFCDEIPWTNCSSSATVVSISHLEGTPWPPKLGANFTGIVSAYAHKDITGGTYHATVKIGLIKVYDKTQDIPDSALPIKEGPIDQKVTLPLPNEPITGKVTGTIQVNDADGNDILCMELQVKPEPALFNGGSVDNCETVKDETTCQSSTDSSGEQCVWCKSAAVPSSCHTASQAKSLPPSIFDCSSP